MPELDPSEDRALALAKRPFVDRDFSFSLVGSVAFHGLFLLASWWMPPSASGLSIDMNDEERRYARYLIEAAAMEPPPPEFLEGDDGGSDPGGKPAPGEEGKAGKVDAPTAVKRRVVQGQSKVDSGSLVNAQNAAQAGILGMLPSGQSESSVFSDLPDGTAAQDFLAALHGRELGASSGFGGLGLRDKGRGGGGPPDGTIGLDRLGTVGDGPGGRGGDGPYGRGVGDVGARRGSRVPVATHGVASVVGSLSKEVIRRTIHQHLAEIRFCYEEGRRAMPELSGRVTVGFVITPSGSVQASRIAHSDLGSPKTEQCIAEALRRWSFPEPENGGVVSVTYPFVLQAAD